MTTPDLEIPARAKNALISASTELTGLAYAASIIVATELRRIAGECEDGHPYRLLHDRADELDPEGA